MSAKQLHADSATIRNAVIEVSVFAAAGMFVTALLAYSAAGATTFSSSRYSQVINAALAAAGDAAPWVFPMYLSALIAGLAVVLLPDWRRREEEGTLLPADAAEIRRAIGLVSRVIAALFLVWAAWVVIAYLIPGLTPGGAGAGVLLASAPTVVLAVFASRAARGTVAQRLRDTYGALLKTRRAFARIMATAIMTTGRPAKWPTALVTIATGACIIAPVILAVLRLAPIAPTITAAITAGLFITAAIWLWRTRQRSTGRVERGLIAVIAVAAVLVGAVTAAAATPTWVAILAGLLALTPAVIVFPNWRGKQLLAGTAVGYITSKLANDRRAFVELARAAKEAGRPRAGTSIRLSTEP